ncbi:site-specific recombinase [Catenibacterium mitsuokai]|uniref:site-specific recombinase n=1 Tax=Catenibacterium mitsuokai TaxID=100886 RepID=UPI002E75F0CA|nr:site-specific recombinase [Catenibacterium tridentinum]
MLGDKSNYQTQLQLNIASVIRASQATSVENIDEKLMALPHEIIQKAQSKEAYDEIADEIVKLREERQQLAVDTSVLDDQIERIKEIQDFIRSQRTDITEFDEALIRRWIKHITVYEDHFTVELKSGLSIDVDE